MSPLFRGIVRFELGLQVRQVTLAAAAVLFAGMAFVLVSTTFGPANAAVNSPYVVMYSVGLLSLFAVFLVTITCTAAALRDADHRMTDLVDATPAPRRSLVLGRFAGAELAAMAVMLLAVVVLAVMPHLVAVPPERLGPTRPLDYAWAFALLAVPNLLFLGAVVFAVASRTRSSVASWVTGVALYALYWVTALVIDSPLMAGSAPATPQAMARAAILDPLGLSAFFEQTRYWGAPLRNSARLALEGHVLLNRVLWLGVAALALLLALRRPRTLRAQGQGPVATPAARISAATRGSAAIAALYLLWAFVIGMEYHGEVGQAEYFTSLYPVTGLLLNAALQPLSLFGTMILVYFAAELAWRERMARLADIVDATPASSLRLYLPRLRALVLLIAGLIAVAIVVGIGYQLARGYPQVNLPLWLALVPLGGLPLVLFAVLALLVQGLSPNRWVGMLLTVGVAVALVRGGDLAPLAHPLTRYGALPGLAWSEMSGFGQELVAWVAFMACWSAAAVLLALITAGTWPRGRRSLPVRAASLPRTIGGAGRLALGTSLVAFTVMVAGLWHLTAARGRFETPEQLAAWKAGYERTWRHIAGAPTPSIEHVQVALDLFPGERRFRAHGRAVMANRDTVPVSTVWVHVRRDVATDTLRVDGARLVAHDARYGVSTFALAQPLAPGDTHALHFDLTYAEPALRADPYDHVMVGNGTFLLSPQAMPTLGYRSTYELQSAVRRRQFGLAAPTAIAALDTTGRTRAGRTERWITLDATVSTPAGQYVVGQGRLERDWQVGNRRYFHYVMDTPMTSRFGFVSARYDVTRVRHGGVDVELYHHPAHQANVAPMLEAATRSLDYFGRAFGPYQYASLRIVEVPSFLDAGALALPGVVYFVEDRGFLTDARDSTRFDIITRRVAHEVAHQWWGHQLAPATVEGLTMLVETLAKYSEQLVLRERRGEAALEPLLWVDENRYREGAAEDLEEEPGLYRVADQSWIYYGKGGVVMHALRDSVGEDAVNQSLRRLLLEHGGPAAPPANTLDLLGYLHQATPPERHPWMDRALREAGLVK